LAPDALREAVGPSLLTLTRREFVSPDRAELAGREAFRFRHQLIRDAAYQAIAKQSRAELHERFADWLEQALGARAAEYQTIIGYHLEQAVRYRRELDSADPALPELGRRAAEQLAAAGMAALDRADAPSAYNLLQRVITLVPDEAESIRWRLVASEAMIRVAPAHDTNQSLIETRELAMRLGDPRSAAVAEALRMHIRSAMGERIGDLVEECERIRAELIRLGDPAGAARAGLELAKAWFWSGRASDAIALAEQIKTAESTPARLRHETIGWQLPFEFWGPTPVRDALAEVDSVLADPDLPRLVVLRAGRSKCSLLAMLGQFDESRRVAEQMLAQHQEYGDRTLIGSLKGHFTGPARYLEGAFDEAAELGIESYELLMALGHSGFANTAAAGAARALVAAGRDAEAEVWAKRCLDIAAEDDPASASPALGALARVHANRGESDAAELADRAVALWEGADHLDLIADAHADRAEVFQALSRASDARSEVTVALELYERKGNVTSAGMARRRLESWEPSSAG
jgi:tetratricopeptide (TPR) repeat protein